MHKLSGRKYCFKTFAQFFFVNITKYIAFLLCMCYSFKLTDYEDLRCKKE